MQALFQDQSLAQEDRRAQMRTISQGTNNSIKAVLNDEQKQKFEAMQQHMRRGPRWPTAVPPPARSSPRLTTTRNQKLAGAP